MAGRTVTNVSMGFCKGEMNKREHGFFRDYIELSAVIEDAGISEHHATNFINTVKSIAHRHGNTISIPSEYRNLKRAVLKQVENRLLPIKCELIPYPKSMFECSVTMKRMSLVHLDVLLVVADIMLHVAKTGIYVITHIYMCNTRIYLKHTYIYVPYVNMCYIRKYVIRIGLKH
jgi:hypothetical protein